MLVHDNFIRKAQRLAAGITQGVGSDAVLTSAQNRFTGNSYVLGDSALKQFRWQNSDRSAAEWQGYGTT
ncbi:MAG: hypothetical protein H0V43_00745 [Gemmatimonadales bacterium]|nr:hypothetical protein [Gemmatimonadales bacterium]